MTNFVDEEMAKNLAYKIIGNYEEFEYLVMVHSKYVFRAGIIKLEVYDENITLKLHTSYVNAGGIKDEVIRVNIIIGENDKLVKYYDCKSLKEIYCHIIPESKLVFSL